MSCCVAGQAYSPANRPEALSRVELEAVSRELDHGYKQLTLTAPDIHCAGCIKSIEDALSRLDGVRLVRVNLSSRQVDTEWRDLDPLQIVDTLHDIGFSAHISAAEAEGEADKHLRELVRCLAVAGFSAANIMLLSVSVWSGADAETRNLFHLISGIIAFPAVAYSGRPFFHSAWRALKGGRMNMDLPISLAVTLALAMSFFETLSSGEHAYFDASVSLLFFLLIGRVLDHMMRRKASRSVELLAKLTPSNVLRLMDDGEQSVEPLDAVQVGWHLLVKPGQHIPVDGLILSGESELDTSLVNGESAPCRVQSGTEVHAGTLNLTSPLEIQATKPSTESFLQRTKDLMAVAEDARPAFRRLSDRVASLYAPVVHLLALGTFLFWFWQSGDWQSSGYTAISVLIVTCPCALGLAIPIVQVVATSRLFQSGIMLKSGEALERLSKITAVLFDKTGTLTLARPAVVNMDRVSSANLALAAGLASHSTHPASKAIVEAARSQVIAPLKLEQIEEIPGRGLIGQLEGHEIKLGRPDWIAPGRVSGADTETLVALAVDGELVQTFALQDALRPAANEAIGEIDALGLTSEIVSGDRPQVVDALAKDIGITRAQGGLLPEDKLTRLTQMQEAGTFTLMVGDGLNDGPALAQADVSMAPSSASDLGRAQADIVFLHPEMTAVPLTIKLARDAMRLIRQNLAIAIIYNCIAVPLAVSGFVTPLIAAVAMSLSSLVVVANALRLYRIERNTDEDRSETSLELRTA